MATSSGPPGRWGFPSGTEGLPYRPQLDSLRALAVGAVLIHHFTGDGWGTGAILGVKLFFVLSGFLITTLLLDARDRAQGGRQRWREAGRFYVRRSLRIFPLYYFVIGACLVIGLEPAREALAWLATYTVNVRFARQGWFDAWFAHFWTLSVEEQFYLVWPWFVLFTPRRWLTLVTVGLVALGPVYRWFAMSADPTGLTAYVMTPSYGDTLGMGALMAVLLSGERTARGIDRFLARRIAPVAAAAFVVIYQLEARGLDGGVSLLASDLLLACTYCGLIYAAVKGITGPVGRLLDTKTLRYTGRISYGIYVYHPFVPALSVWTLAQLGWNHSPAPIRDFVLFTGVTFSISAFSWHFLEKPLKDLARSAEPTGHASGRLDQATDSLSKASGTLKDCAEPPPSSRV